MAQRATTGQYIAKTLPILGNFNQQRFKQWSPEDSANWYLVNDENTKRPYAMYPCMGRSHLNFQGNNQLIFGSEPRQMFKSILYGYIVEGNTIYRIDNNYNRKNISGSNIVTSGGEMYFTFLVVTNIVFACFVDDQKIYIYREDTDTFAVVTDTNAPGNYGTTKPGFIAAFGNRIVVSIRDSAQFVLSKINLDGDSFNAATCFTNATGQVAASEEGIIRQMGVLNNTLYIFTDYITGVWSNNPAVFSGTGVTFPWKKSSTYNWNFGIANPKSLAIDFGMLVFLGRNYEGLIQFMVSDGGQPKSINSKAVSTLLQKYTDTLGSNNPFLSLVSNGFLFQYEDVIFYRMSGGRFDDTQILDQELKANSIEYNFNVQEWHRCIEVNGNRNKINYHIYFNHKHLVSVLDENTVYEMSGRFYYNEERNAAQSDPQASDAYLAYPFRYERITPIICEEDYGEFETDFVQIDFIFGDSDISYSLQPFENTVFIVDEASTSSNPIYIVDEDADSDGEPVYVITEDSNYPELEEKTYNAMFKPNISLYWSDDGGISFHNADNREFSQMGVYRWRMRWYQMGCSRNRVYKLIAVSPVPIVILGGIMNIKRVSDGAY